MPNAKIDGTSALVTWPVDVWFSGKRTFDAVLDFGRAITSVQLDPGCRFPDRDPATTSGPRSTAPAPAGPAAARCGG
jgi:hypothetical protein